MAAEQQRNEMYSTIKIRMKNIKVNKVMMMLLMHSQYVTLVLWAQRQRNVFKYDLNVDSDGAGHTITGRLFQALDPAIQQTHVRLG